MADRLLFEQYDDLDGERHLLLCDASGTYVVVEMPDGTKENRPVKTGIYSDDYVEILDGLIEGETVSISYTATQPQVMMMGGGGHPPM